MNLFFPGDSNFLEFGNFVEIAKKHQLFIRSLGLLKDDEKTRSVAEVQQKKGYILLRSSISQRCDHFWTSKLGFGHSHYVWNSNRGGIKWLHNSFSRLLKSPLRIRKIQGSNENQYEMISLSVAFNITDFKSRDETSETSETINRFFIR